MASAAARRWGAGALALVLLASAPAHARPAPLAPPQAQPLAQPPAQVQAPLRAPSPGGTVIHPHGPQFGYPDPADPSRFIWVFLGGVDVEQPGRRLEGETLVVVLAAGDSPASSLVDPPPGSMQFAGDRLIELYLDGNVQVDEGREQISGASAFHLDARTGVATVVEGELRTQSSANLPLVARFDLLKRLQDGTTVMRNLEYTNCDFAKPHWHVRTPYAKLTDSHEGRVLSTGPNVAAVGGVPVLWLPGLDLDVDGEGLLLTRVHVGDSSRFGTEIGTRWSVDASPVAQRVMGMFGEDARVHADFDLGVSWLSKRGLLLEPELEYRTEKSKGVYSGIYIRDQANEDHLGQPIESASRGSTKLEHRTRIDDRQTLDIEFSRQSDANFLTEYDEREARDDKPQETYLSYRDVVDNHAKTLLVSTRLNDFQTQAIYQPELALRQAGQALDGGFFLTAKEFVSKAALAQADGSTTPTTRDTRAGVDVLLTRPWDLDNGDRMEFITQLDLTGFQDTVDDGSALRYALGAGLEWSRVYSGTGPASSETWNLDGLRRIVEPRIGIFDRFEVSMSPDELLQIDQVEQLREENVVVLGLRDRIQTHQDGEVATLLNTDVSLPIYLDPDRDNEGETYGPMRLDTVWRPRADVFALRESDLHWRAKFDVNDGHYTESFASYTTSLGRDRSLGLSENKVFHEFNYRTISLGWRLNPKWDTAIYYQEDVTNNSTASAGFLLRQLAHCWYIDFELSTRQATDINGDPGDEVQFAVRFRPALSDRETPLVEEVGTYIP